jgi:hypothetical protein
MDPSDSQYSQSQVMDSLSLLAEHAPATVLGLPGSSADLSACAVPFHPGRPARCSCSLLPLPWQASPLSGGLATSISVTRPNRVRLRYGSRVRSPGLRHRDYSRRRPVRYLLNEQFARQPPFRLRGPPGLSWRSRDAEREPSIRDTKAGVDKKRILSGEPESTLPEG